MKAFHKTVRLVQSISHCHCTEAFEFHSYRNHMDFLENVTRESVTLLTNKMSAVFKKTS